MAEYSLGRHKKTLSTQKIREFTEVYSKLIVQAYAELSKNYSGVKAVIKKVNKVDDNMFIINMEILKKDFPVILRLQLFLKCLLTAFVFGIM